MIRKLVLFTSAAGMILFVFISLLMYKESIPQIAEVDSNGIYKKLNSLALEGKDADFTEQEINYMADKLVKSNMKAESVLKSQYIDIADDRFDLTARVKMFKKEFYVKAAIKPYMDKDSMELQIQKVTVGKVRIPDRLVMHVIKRYLPSNIKIGVNNAIIINNNILTGLIDKITINENILSIYLLKNNPDFIDNIKDTESASDSSKKAKYENNGSNLNNPNNYSDEVYSNERNQNTHSESNNGNKNKNQQSSNGTGANAGLASKVSETEKKVNALKKFQSQLFSVLKDLRDSDSRQLIKKVISINSKMIKNPEGNFMNDIYSAVSVYQKLPKEDKDVIISSAYKNLDVNTVKYLFEAYRK